MPDEEDLPYLPSESRHASVSRAFESINLGSTQRMSEERTSSLTPTPMDFQVSNMETAAKRKHGDQDVVECECGNKEDEGFMVSSFYIQILCLRTVADVLHSYAARNVIPGGMVCVMDSRDLQTTAFPRFFDAISAAASTVRSLMRCQIYASSVAFSTFAGTITFSVPPKRWLMIMVCQRSSFIATSYSSQVSNHVKRRELLVGF